MSRVPLPRSIRGRLFVTVVVVVGVALAAMIASFNLLLQHNLSRGADQLVRARAAAELALVRTHNGGVTVGETVEGIWLAPGEAVFQGIRYAAPPVGDLRWRPPAPLVPRAGVQPAKDPGPACVQTDRLTMFSKSIAAVFKTEDRVRSDPIRTSEDCLVLNVWTDRLGIAGNAGGGAPVMVYMRALGGVSTSFPSFGSVWVREPWRSQYSPLVWVCITSGSLSGRFRMASSLPVKGSGTVVKVNG